MNVIQTIQGSEEWLQLRRSFHTASEAPAAMGQSKYQTRAELLKQKAGGLIEEVNGAKQALFDRGHKSEADARPLAEALVDSELYPVTATLTVDGIRLLASLDGATMMETEIFEHKLYSESLAADVRAGTLDPHYTIQMDQQLLVSGAKRCLFMTSDGTEKNMAWCWYKSSPEKHAALISAWKQFDEDLTTYTLAKTVLVAVPKVATSLAVVLDMRVEGKLVSCNLDAYKPLALAYIADINTKLVTDQHFADATTDAKFCRDSAVKLKLSIEQALGQMGDINAVISAVRDIASAFDAKGLALEKLVKTEKDNRKLAIIMTAREALRAHEVALRPRTQGHLLQPAHIFETVIKGLQKLESVQNAVDTELARCKINLNAEADKIQTNLETLAALGHPELFADIGKMVLKAPDDMLAVATARIDKHKEAEAAKEEATRVRIRAEERAGAEREAHEKMEREQADAANAAKIEAARMQREQMEQLQAQRIRSEEQAKAQAPAIVAPLAIELVAKQAPASRNSAPTLKLGMISERLGFTLTEAFLHTLGFEFAALDRTSKLYHESDFPLICDALIAHIGTVENEYEGGAA